MAHEALIQHWRLCKDWLNEDRQFLLWRKRLGDAREEWLRAGRDSGALLSGARLTEADRWCKQRGDLTDEEREYIGRSVSLKRRRHGLAGAAVAVVLAAFAAILWLCVSGLTMKHGTAMVLSRVGLYQVREPAMVKVPAGEFLMGSGDDDSEAYPKEKPRHGVVIGKPFAIGKYEMTFEEYDQFALATGRPLPPDQGWGRGQRPVINVPWDDADAYGRWLSKMTGKSYRLLTEAEWEYAARARTTWRRFWSDAPNQACRYANVADRSYAKTYGGDTHDCDDGHVFTTEVGPFEANPFGLHDMLGNVWEWVQDCWHESYEGAPEDSSKPWREESSGDCNLRVIRGGSWFNKPWYVRSAARDLGEPGTRSNARGFRLAQDLD